MYVCTLAEILVYNIYICVCVYVDEINGKRDTLANARSLNTDFASLLMTVSAILDNSTDAESELDKCRNYCSSLRTSDNSDHPLFSPEDISMINNCTDFNKLFRILHWHLSWDEHSILTDIVAKCQSAKAQEEIENFDKKLAAICELEIVSNIPEYDLPSEFKKFSVVINGTYKNLTASKYEEIKDFVFKQLDTKHYVATRCIKILFHSLRLEWCVAGQAVPFMISMAYQNKDVFIKEGFVFMQIGEDTIFDNQVYSNRHAYMCMHLPSSIVYMHAYFYTV